MNMKRLVKYQLGLGVHEFYADACVKGPYGLLSMAEQPLGMKGLQHILVTFDEADLRPERGGSSLSTRMACPFVEGQNPQECHRIRNFNHRLTEADYNYLKEKCEKFLRLYDEWDYCLDIQQYLMGGLGLMISMDRVEKFYSHLKEKNHVGKYFFANWDVFYREFFEFVGFPSLTGDTVSGPVKKADMQSWKNFRSKMRDEGAFDFRQKSVVIKTKNEELFDTMKEIIIEDFDGVGGIYYYTSEDAFQLNVLLFDFEINMIISSLRQSAHAHDEFKVFCLYAEHYEQEEAPENSILVIW